MRTAAQEAPAFTFTQLTRKLAEQDGPRLSKHKWQIVIRALVGSGHLYYRFQRSTDREDGISPLLYVAASSLRNGESFKIAAK